MANQRSTRDLGPHGDGAGRVVVAGYGPVGRAVVQGLEQAGFGVTIIELNLKTIESQLGLNKSVVYGSATDPAVLKRAGVAQARALILAIPDEHAALEACEQARRIAPDIFIAARTNYLSKGLLCTQAGADHVTIEEVVTAQAMQHAVVERLTGNSANPTS